MTPKDVEVVRSVDRDRTALDEQSDASRPAGYLEIVDFDQRGTNRVGVDRGLAPRRAPVLRVHRLLASRLGRADVARLPINAMRSTPWSGGKAGPGLFARLLLR